VPSFPVEELTEDHLKGFVDDKLRHNIKRPKSECTLNDYGLEIYRKEKLVDQNVHNEIFFNAMKIYCDLESGIAFEHDYEWPKAIMC